MNISIEEAREAELNLNFENNPGPSPQAVLREIGRLQEELNRLREHLLVERAKLRLVGEDVRHHRFETSNMEGQFLTSLRVYFNEHRIYLPSSIEEAFEKVEQARDRMGVMEDDYMLEERAVGAVERLFMQKENVFYQHHLPELFTQITSSLPQQRMQPNSYPSTSHHHPPPPPPPPPDSIVIGDGMVLVHDAPPPPPPTFSPLMSHSMSQGLPQGQLLSSSKRMDLSSSPRDTDKQYNLAKAELVDLRKKFDSFRPQQSEVIKHEIESGKPCFRAPRDYECASDFEEQYSEVLSKLSACEVKVQRLHVETAQFRGSPDMIQRRRSAPLQTEMLNSLPLTSMVRAQTVIAPEGYNKIQMESRVREWIREYSRNNPIERKVYANILMTKGIKISENDSLKQWTEDYWPTGVAEDSSVSAGDESLNVSGNSASLPCPSHHISSDASKDISLAKEPNAGKQLFMPERFCPQSDHSSPIFQVHRFRSRSAVDNASAIIWNTQDMPSHSFTKLVPESSRTKLRKREDQILMKRFHHDRCRSASTVPINFKTYNFRGNIAASACTV